jgi:hypothetical protein
LAETLAALENAVWSRRKTGMNRSGKPLPKPIVEKDETDSVGPASEAEY